MSFEKLLEELDSLQTLQKSEPADMPEDNDGDTDDAGIAASAADGEADEAGEGEGHAEPDGDEGEGGEGDNDGDEKPFAKSLTFTLDSGEEVEAVDGTELVKSLIDRFDSTEETMQKAMGSMVDLIKSQGEEISLLKSEVKRLGSAGRGRKAVVSVVEKPAAETMTKSEPAGISGDQFMAKALSAQAAGKLTALDVAKAEGYLLKGLAVPADIVTRVLS